MAEHIKSVTSTEVKVDNQLTIPSAKSLLPELTSALLKRESRETENPKNNQRKLFSSSSDEEEENFSKEKPLLPPSSLKSAVKAVKPFPKLAVEPVEFETANVHPIIATSSSTFESKPLPLASPSTSLSNKKESLFASSSSSEEKEEMPKAVLKALDAKFSDKLTAAIKHGPPTMRPVSKSCRKLFLFFFRIDPLMIRQLVVQYR